MTEDRSKQVIACLGKFCPACQAIPAAGLCRLAGCPFAPGLTEYQNGYADGYNSGRVDEAAEAGATPLTPPTRETWTIQSSIYEGFSSEIWADDRKPGQRTIAVVRDYKDAVAILADRQKVDEGKA